LSFFCKKVVKTEVERVVGLYQENTAWCQEWVVLQHFFELSSLFAGLKRHSLGYISGRLPSDEERHDEVVITIDQRV